MKKYVPKFASLATIATLGFLALTTALAMAQDQPAAAPAPAAPKIDTGDTAWMLTSTALVLMMTIPGLALFYGGMVRRKNVLATVAQSFGATCLITVLWMIIGYSIAFTDGGSHNSWYGGFSDFFLIPMGLKATSSLSPKVPESVFLVLRTRVA